MFRKKYRIDFKDLIDGELALARRGGYSFGVVVIKSDIFNDIDTVQKLVRERVRPYDFVAPINSRSCIVVLRNILSSDVEKIVSFILKSIKNVKIDYYVFPEEDKKFNSVLDCKEYNLNISFLKRCFDILFSLIMIVLLMPVCVLVAFMIKISSPGSVFFVQERIGYKGRTFLMYKFRTMHENASQNEHVSYLKDIIRDSKNRLGKITNMRKKEDSNRIFPLGRLIRKYCFDEIPQFYNVLKGDMSIVGPRPPVRYEVEEYEEWYKERFDIYPGLTGLWQVSGKNNLSFEKMIKLDILYKKRINIFNDIKIICKTPVVIMKQFI